jgi:hypothetical protein
MDLRLLAEVGWQSLIGHMCGYVYFFPFFYLVSYFCFSDFQTKFELQCLNLNAQLENLQHECNVFIFFSYASIM